MKVTPSPLVSSMAGKTAGLVAASWKGIQYVRMHVIPANPQTAAQTAVREAFARCVTLWRSLSTAEKTWLDAFYADYAMSGFNGFIRLCRTLEDADALLKPIPDNPYCPVVHTFAAAAGAAGEIDVTWAAGNIPDDFDHVVAIARLTGTNIFVAAVVVGDAAATLTLPGLATGEDYDVYAWYRKGLSPYDGGTSTGELAVTAG